jgi:hypothetical protein
VEHLLEVFTYVYKNWKNFFTVGRAKWTRFRWGIIIGVGNPQYYIVRYDCGRIAWIRKNEIIF